MSCTLWRISYLVLQHGIASRDDHLCYYNCIVTGIILPYNQLLFHLQHLPPTYHTFICTSWQLLRSSMRIPVGLARQMGCLGLCLKLKGKFCDILLHIFMCQWQERVRLIPEVQHLSYSHHSYSPDKPFLSRFGQFCNCNSHFSLIPTDRVQNSTVKPPFRSYG